MITAGVCPEFQLSPTHEFKNVVFLSSVPIIVFHFILLASVRTSGKKKKKLFRKASNSACIICCFCIHLSCAYTIFHHRRAGN